MCKILLLLCISMGLNENMFVEPATIPESHNEVWGARSSGDVLIKREIVKETFKPLRVVSSDYEFRQKADSIVHPRTITQIVVTDIYTDGDGGYASLKSGGPGMDFAVIHLKSQRGHGYHFTLDFYGQ
ncbi:PREDICTED: probable salivary secreted peptide [Bactrocera latifrons]|uniref:Putative salivary secreted peptide n=1 Tax=Bactrocera latifrons TaxID=174628 RepID=A0A0K8UKH2_BACLA|nr:PREDICTED: probable salivary secreted peptide [Bactrocera latifrons]